MALPSHLLHSTLCSAFSFSFHFDFDSTSSVPSAVLICATHTYAHTHVRERTHTGRDSVYHIFISISISFAFHCSTLFLSHSYAQNVNSALRCVYQLFNQIMLINDDFGIATFSKFIFFVRSLVQ